MPECKTRRVFSAVVLLLSFLLVSALLSKPPHDSNKRGNLRLQDTPTSIYTLTDFSIRNLQETDQCTLDCCGQYQTDLCAAPSSWINAVPDAIQWILIVFLVCMSAMFSGLTLGLLSLDKTGLEILIDGDDVKNAAAAKKIYPHSSTGKFAFVYPPLGKRSCQCNAEYPHGRKGWWTCWFLDFHFCHCHLWRNHSASRLLAICTGNWQQADSSSQGHYGPIPSSLLATSILP